MLTDDVDAGQNRQDFKARENQEDHSEEKRVPKTKYGKEQGEYPDLNKDYKSGRQKIKDSPEFPPLRSIKKPSDLFGDYTLGIGFPKFHMCYDRVRILRGIYRRGGKRIALSLQEMSSFLKRKDW